MTAAIANSAAALACLIALPSLATLAAGQTPLEVPAFYPEGALLHEGHVFYAEMGADRVTRLSPASGDTHVFWTAPGCGPTAIAPVATGFLVLCHLADKLALVTGDGRTEREVTNDAEGRTLHNPNAATPDGAGGAYFSVSGSFRAGAPAEGAVYHLSADGVLRRVVSGLHYTNGVLVRAGGQELLVSEHLARRVLRFEIATDGALSGGGVFIELPPATGPTSFPPALIGPDGLAQDSRGRIYIADYGAGRVLATDADGGLLAAIETPLPFVTSVALSPDGQLLYVTAARDNRTPPFPGAVFQLENPLP